MKSIKDFINEGSEILDPNGVNRQLLPDDERYAVIFTGGSLADAERQKFMYGWERCSVCNDNLTKDEAKELAKRKNSFLTPGEKKYYQMKYRAVLSKKITEV